MSESKGTMYTLKPKDDKSGLKPRLVRAFTNGSALKHAALDTWTCEKTTVEEAVRLGKAGVEEENALGVSA